jgi:hypothetical protein
MEISVVAFALVEVFAVGFRGAPGLAAARWARRGGHELRWEWLRCGKNLRVRGRTRKVLLLWWC